MKKLLFASATLLLVLMSIACLAEAGRELSYPPRTGMLAPYTLNQCDQAEDRGTYLSSAIHTLFISGCYNNC